MGAISLAQVLSVVRYGLTLIGGYFVTKGYLSNDVVTSLGGTLPAVVSLIWSILTHAPVAVADVASTVGAVAGTVVTATKDGETKAVVQEIQDAITRAYPDIAKGSIG